MNKKVAGVFASDFDAVREIDSIMDNGVDREHIYVMAMDDLKEKSIKERTGVHIIQDLNREKMFELGWPEEEAVRYLRELEMGRILVLVDENHDLGSTDALTTEHIPIKNDQIKVDGGFPLEGPGRGRPEKQEWRGPGRPLLKRPEDMQFHSLKKEFEEETDPFEKRGAWNGAQSETSFSPPNGRNGPQ
jgi:hypothetical protein